MDQETPRYAPGFDWKDIDPDDPMTRVDPGVGIGSYRVELPERADDATPEERIATLFQNMKSYKGFLTAIIDFCRDAKASEEIDEMLASRTEKRRCPYSPISLRRMLERAGALAFIQDEEYDEDDLEDEEGNLIIPEEIPGAWLSTDEGLAYLASIDELKATLDVITAEERVTPIYVRILEYCAEESRTPSQIGQLVDDDPLLQKPKRFWDYFVGRLEDAGGMQWNGAWTVTDKGLAALEQLKEDAR